MTTPAQAQGSRANAEFYRRLGLDPDLITSDPPTVTIVKPDLILVYYQGFIQVTGDQLADAFAHLGEEP